MVGYLSCVLGIVFDTREGCGASLSTMGIVFDTREGCGALPFGVPGIVFDTREGYVTSLSVMGIVFDTREGCGASLSVMGIVSIPVRAVGLPFQ